MKHKKLLFVIGLMVLADNSSKAQNIKDNAKFLYLGYNIHSGRNSIGYEQINKIGTVNSVNYFKFGRDTIAEKNNKVYFVNKGLSGDDSVLYFDYSLKEGDTFYFNSLTKNIPIRVDSIRIIKLNDGKGYKHWYLDAKFASLPLIWVEGLGEKNMGWIRYDWISADGSDLKSICINDSLVYWDSRYNGFEPYSVSPTCAYDTLLKYNSIKSITDRHITIFPNPANSSIHFSGLERGTSEIYNTHGSLLQSGILEKEISVRDLFTGLYFIRLFDSKSNYYETHKIVIQH